MPRHQAVLTREVAPGVHRLEHAHVNCYLLEGDGEGWTLVDTALPGTWRFLDQAARAIGRSLDDLRGVVLTHAHFDHLGMAHRLQQERGVPIWVHDLDESLAHHPYRYAHERPRLGYPLRYPAALVVLTRMAAAGALSVRGIDDLRPMASGDVLPVPGSPRVVFTPGHTYGHCALELPGRDAVLSGDSLVTLDPYTGVRGPQIVSGAATADSAMTLATLEALAATGARTVLPGHGDPWHGGVREAVAEARRRGAS